MIRRSSLTAVAALLCVAPAFAFAQGTQPDTSKAAPPPPKVVTPQLDFSGWLFGSYSIQTDDAAKAANGGKAPNKFDINRAYLTFKMPVGDRASIRVTTDIKQGGSTADYKGWFVRLKYGFVQYDFLKSATPGGLSAYGRIGMLHTVVIDHEENFWPRYLSQVALERNGFFSSADLGVSTGWTLPNKWGEIYGTITSGNGYENPEADRFKDFAVRLSLTPLSNSTSLLKTFVISPWGYFGKSASQFAKDPTDPITKGLDRNRWGVFAGNRDRRLTFGAEYAQRTDGSETGATPVANVISNRTGQLYDAFAIVRPLEFQNPELKHSFGFVGRFDQFKANKDVDGATQFIVGGVFWEPTAKTALALDYQEAKPVSGLSGNKQQTWFLHWQAYF